MRMPQRRRPRRDEWGPTTLGTMMVGGSLAHLLPDRALPVVHTAHPWVDPAFVIVFLLGCLILVQRFAPGVLPWTLRLVEAAKPFGRRKGDTAERPTGRRRKRK